MGIFERIARWLMPYKFIHDDNPEPRNRQERIERRHALREAKRKERVKAEILKNNPSLKGDSQALEKAVSTKVPDTPPKIETPPTADIPTGKKATKQASDAIKRGKLGVTIVNVSSAMKNEDALDRMQKSNTHIAYYFHDRNYHQIAVKFEPKSAWRFYERDDLARKKLKPLLYPKADRPFDRTHVIPIGFHGSENDNRLLVGFNSDINRHALNEFEKRVKRINETKTVLWFVSIEKQADGSALWHAEVWDRHGKTLMSRKFHDKDVFVWN